MAVGVKRGVADLAQGIAPSDDVIALVEGKGGQSAQGVFGSDAVYRLGELFSVSTECCYGILGKVAG